MARTALAAATLLALLAPSAQMPAQSNMDSTQWPLITGGLNARPYISSMTRLPAGGGAAVPLWTALGSPSASPPAGYEATNGALTALVIPTNLCNVGQTPAQGVCYLSPNRVAITLAVNNGTGNANQDLTGFLTPGDVIELVLQMGSGAFAGSNVQWSWANGVVSRWNVSTSAGGATSITVRIAPTPTPVPDWSSMSMGSQCCTCDMPSNCPLQRASAFTLSANFFVSVGASATPLAGAMFATTNAVMGGLALGSGGSSLDYAFASAHLAPDSSLLTGSLNAFVPSATVAALFGGLSSADAAAALNVTRTGDPGTQASVAIAPVTASSFGSDGVLVTVNGVTFSAPTYSVALHASGGSRAAPLLVVFAAVACFLWSL